MGHPGIIRELRDGKLKCPDCPPGVWLPLEDFANNAERPYGKGTYCAVHHRERARRSIRKRAQKTSYNGLDPLKSDQIVNFIACVHSGRLMHVVSARPWNNSLNLEVAL